MPPSVQETKSCPVCHGTFPAGTQQCPVDGVLLVAPDARIGTVLDERFELIKVLGEGASGIVYEARQKGFDRPVAVKLLKLVQANDQSAALRFKREAQLLNRIQHPNVASVYAFGITPDGYAYLVCELVVGQRLSAFINEARQPNPALSIDIVKQLCSALACLHANGIVHRDVKPGNIMIVWQPDSKPLVKLLDFGSAKLIENLRQVEQKLTQTGEVLGTINYVSPEQAAGKDVDARTDIFSAGRILYDLTVVDGNVPASVAGIINRATREAPGERYASAEEMEQALAKLNVERLGERMTAIGSGKPRHSHVHPLLWLAPAVMALAFFFYLTQSDSGTLAVSKYLLNTYSLINQSAGEQFADRLHHQFSSHNVTKLFISKWLVDHCEKTHGNGSLEHCRAEFAYIDDLLAARNKPMAQPLMNAVYNQAKEHERIALDRDDAKTAAAYEDVRLTVCLPPYAVAGGDSAAEAAENYAHAYLSKADFVSAKRMALLALKHRQLEPSTGDNNAAIARIHVVLGNVALLQADYREANKEFDKAVAATATNAERQTPVRAWLQEQLGSLATSLSRLKQAATYSGNSARLDLKLLDEQNLSDLDREITEESFFHASSQASFAENQLGHHAQAESYAKEALKRSDLKSFSKWEPELTTRLMDAQICGGKDIQPLTTSALKSKDELVRCYAYTIRGSQAYNEARFADAAELFTQGMNCITHDTLPLKAMRRHTQLHLAMSLLAQKQPQKAIEELDKIDRTLGANEIAMKANLAGQYCLAYGQMNQPQRALQFAQQELEIADRYLIDIPKFDFPLLHQCVDSTGALKLRQLLQKVESAQASRRS